MKRTMSPRKSPGPRPKPRKMIDVDIVREGGAAQWTPEMFARAVARQGLETVPKKTLLSLRIDADVIEWFRKRVPGSSLE